VLASIIPRIAEKEEAAHVELVELMGKESI